MNRLWQAVNIVRGRRAVSLVYVGRGMAVGKDFAVYSWEGWCGRSTDATDPLDSVLTTAGPVRIPRVIQLLEYDRMPRPRVKFTRSNVYLRDRHRCQYCGTTRAAEELTLDHVLPRSRGGPTNWSNIVVSCFRCNSRKADRMPDEAGMPLLKTPKAPQWHPSALLRTTEDPDPTWQPFLVSAAR